MGETMNSIGHYSPLKRGCSEWCCTAWPKWHLASQNELGRIKNLENAIGNNGIVVPAFIFSGAPFPANGERTVSACVGLLLSFASPKNSLAAKKAPGRPRLGRHVSHRRDHRLFSCSLMSKAPTAATTMFSMSEPRRQSMTDRAGAKGT